MPQTYYVLSVSLQGSHEIKRLKCDSLEFQLVVAFSEEVETDAVFFGDTLFHESDADVLEVGHLHHVSSHEQRLYTFLLDHNLSCTKNTTT